jgi:hypothetical protein
MGSAAGVAKVAARRVGLDVAEYQRRCAAGEKWCTLCRAWWPIADFCTDRHRASGLAARCRRHSGPRRPEQVDKRRARRLVNSRVRRGKLAPAATLACVDCGGPAAEYDHHLGYSKQHAADVEAVCVSCHADRGVRRGEFRRG